MFLILRDAFNLVLPRTCHVCGALLSDDERFVCTPCLSTLPRTGYHSVQKNRFEERFAGIFPFERGASVFFYDKGGDLAGLVHDFKYRGFPGLARELGRIMGRELSATGFLDGIDVIIPVGMHWLKRIRRGYNQAVELARGLAEEINRTRSKGSVSVEIWDCLEMARYHTSQTRRSADQRVASVRGLFRLRHGYDLTGQRVLLLDDICTTGSTMTAAAETLTASTQKIGLRLLTLASTY